MDYCDGIDVYLVDAGNIVECLVYSYGKRHEALAEWLRDANSLHAGIEFLETLCCDVGKHQGYDIADDGGEETPCYALGHEVYHGTDEGEMLVVLEVDVHSARAAEQQQY